MPVKWSGQTYFCSDTIRFLPDKCLSSRIIWLALYGKIHADYYKLKYFTTLHTLSWICGDDFKEDQAISFQLATPTKWKTTVTAPPRGASRISRGRRAAKFGRNLTKSTAVQHIWDLSRLMGLFLLSICKFILKLCHCNEKTSQNYRPVFLDYYCERALASAWYKKLCHWRISEFPDVKRTNDEKKT